MTPAGTEGESTTDLDEKSETEELSNQSDTSVSTSLDNPSPVSDSGVEIEPTPIEDSPLTRILSSAKAGLPGTMVGLKPSEPVRGRPRVYTEEERKERRREYNRKYNAQRRGGGSKQSVDKKPSLSEQVETLSYAIVAPVLVYVATKVLGEVVRPATEEYAEEAALPLVRIIMRHIPVGAANPDAIDLLAFLFVGYQWYEAVKDLLPKSKTERTQSIERKNGKEARDDISATDPATGALLEALEKGTSTAGPN